MPPLPPTSYSFQLHAGLKPLVQRVVVLNPKAKHELVLRALPNLVERCSLWNRPVQGAVQNPLAEVTNLWKRQRQTFAGPPMLARDTETERRAVVETFDVKLSVVEEVAIRLNIKQTDVEVVTELVADVVNSFGNCRGQGNFFHLQRGCRVVILDNHFWTSWT